ncbi:MAG: Mlc titration factor MtfA (ptsG expression regulator) [Phenylobacterium sp.]|jgi:Mlc titration factor MtfA (ptsG expression regulator)
MMTDYLFKYILPLFLGLLVLGYLFGKPLLVELKRNKIRRQPFPAVWRKIIKKRMPYFATMPTDLQLQLKKHIQVFIAEKTFVGYEGITINDDIKVTVAAQACLLLLNRKTDYYPKLQTIVIYPSAFIKKQFETNEIGLEAEKTSVMLGESWEFGKVILSWQHAVEGAKIPNDGANVVIHEFAHQLDQETGSANGAPWLGKTGNVRCWSAVFEKEFAQLKQQTELGVESLLDSYGATNPAEFFAVASEVYFEQAHQLYQQHRSLYRQLRQFYQVDPVNWT